MGCGLCVMGHERCVVGPKTHDARPKTFCAIVYDDLLSR